MEKIKIGIKQSKKGLICSIIAIVGIVVGLVMYIVTTGNTNGKVSIVLIAIIAALLAATSCFLFYADGFLSIISAAFSLYCMLMFVSSQADSIGYAAAGISDIGYGIQSTLIVGCICYLAAVVTESIAVFSKQ